MQELSQRGALDDTTVLFIDLDGFKEVNDALGHESGDGVLRDVASRIAADIPDGVTVGRLGGDEFLAIMRTDEAEALAVAHGIISGIEELGTSLTRFPAEREHRYRNRDPWGVRGAAPAPGRPGDVPRQGCGPGWYDYAGVAPAGKS